MSPALALRLLFLAALLRWAPAQAVETQEGAADFTVIVVSCQKDPGDIGGPQGRTDLKSEYGCQPAPNVGVTAYSFDLGYQQRCDTDAEGKCVFHAPSSPDDKIQLAVHTATLPIGEEPREAIVSTVNSTEFRGGEIVILPTDVGDGVQSRTTLTVTVSGCASGPCADADLLAQVSPAGMTSRDAAWLAPDDDGSVIFDISQLSGDAVDLKVTAQGHPQLLCRDAESGSEVKVEWMDEREGTFARISVPESTSIDCDMEIAA